MDERSGPGLDLNQALACVGPGWEPLVWTAWELIPDAGGTVTSIGRERGAMRVFHVMPPRTPEEVYQLLSELETDSAHRCEICGQPGKAFPDATTDPGLLPRYLREVRVTCPVHTTWRRVGADWNDLVRQEVEVDLDEVEGEKESARPDFSCWEEPVQLEEAGEFDLDSWRKLAGIRGEPDTSDWAVGWSVERDAEDDEEDDWLAL